MTYSPSTTKMIAHLPAVMNIARRIAVSAGEAIMQYYDPSGFQGQVDFKSDNSPVTHADLLSDQMIRDGLHDALPGIPTITEETVHDRDHDRLGESPYFWLIDGLDGTKAFRKGDPDFTVNIALIHVDTPVVGVVYAPALGDGYMGFIDAAKDVSTAYKWRDDENGDMGDDVDIRVRKIPPAGLILLSGVSDHFSAKTQNLVDQVKINRHIKRHSSIKFCEIAAGRADMMAVSRDIYFWDSAAGDAVLRAAGGHVVGWDGAPLKYDRAHPELTNQGLIGCNDIDYIKPILDDINARNA